MGRKFVSMCLAVLMALSLGVSASAAMVLPEKEGFYAPDPCGEGEIYISPEQIQKAEEVVNELMEADIIEPPDGAMPLNGSETVDDSFTLPEEEGFYAPDPCGEGEIYISPEQIQKAEEVVNELMEAGIIEPPDGIMPLYGSEAIGDYSTWDFAFALTGQDGVPVTAITLIKKFAADAKSVADEEYPDITTMNDSCRHFVWNYKGARSSGVGAYNMRVHGNNYEWAHLCNSELSSRYATRKTYWINQGETDPFTKAFTDTCAYFETVRNQKVSAIKSGGYSTFAKYVDTSSAMDFWNNIIRKAVNMAIKELQEIRMRMPTKFMCRHIMRNC